MITFQLNEQQVALIGAALGKLPFEQVAGLVSELQRQISEQTKVSSNQE